MAGNIYLASITLLTISIISATIISYKKWEKNIDKIKFNATMKKTIFIILLVLSLSVMAQSQQYKITVYGLTTCGYTSQLRIALIRENIPYTFLDVQENIKYSNECFDFADKYHLMMFGVTYFPIVKLEMYGQTFGFVRPDPNVIVILTKTTDINEINKQIFVYPNPAHDYIQISGMDRQLEIYSISGAKVLSAFGNKFDVSGLKAGQYIVIVGGNNMKLVKK